ncbi:MAG: PLP-dependent aminotransferase family protein [Flavobacteriaceae bacterium]
MNTNYKFIISRVSKEYTQQKKRKPYNKYIVLYRSLKICIHNREIPHNWLLPSTRLLASELKMSRTTINKAFELLQLEKIIIAKPGSGSRVNYDPATEIQNNSEPILDCHENYPQISEKGISYLSNLVLLNRPHTNNLAFRPGLPPLDVFPANQWKKLMDGYWRYVKSSGLSYSNSTGIIDLKKSIQNYLNVSRNIKCNHRQIVVVSGSLQSLYLISNSLINPKDSVVVENPLFPNVHSVFKSSQANLIPIEIDNEGLDIKKLEMVPKAKIIHVTPSNHYPLGVKMSLKRRQEILQWASKNSALVIENDYENEIANATESIPSIYSLDTQDRTIYIGTFNRLLHPSIRLGYMILPKYLVATVSAIQEHSHRFVSPSIQVVMNQFIDKNYLYKHIKTSLLMARKRHDLFVSIFNEKCKTMQLQKKPFSSFHLLAFFKNKISTDKEQLIIQKLKQHKISVFSLRKCYVGHAQKQGLILGYSSVRPAVLKRKLDLLIKVLNKEL